jgi:hypothetical protein
MIMLVYYQDFPFPLSLLPERSNVENQCSIGEIISEFEAFGKFSHVAPVNKLRRVSPATPN